MEAGGTCGLMTPVTSHIPLPPQTYCVICRDERRHPSPLFPFCCSSSSSISLFTVAKLCCHYITPFIPVRRKHNANHLRTESNNNSECRSYSVALTSIPDMWQISKDLPFLLLFLLLSESSDFPSGLPSWMLCHLISSF